MAAWKPVNRAIVTSHGDGDDLLLVSPVVRGPRFRLRDTFPRRTVSNTVSVMAHDPNGRGRRVSDSNDRHSVFVKSSQIGRRVLSCRFNLQASRLPKSSGKLGSPPGRG